MHALFYKFSLKNIKKMHEYKAYTFILSHFLVQHKDSTLASCKAMQESKPDFIEGFKALQIQVASIL
jgi:hypothetical protein